MNKLFSDKSMVKLNKVPTIVWVLLLGLTMFFANAYGSIEGARTVADMATDSYSQAGVNVNTTGFFYFICIFEALIYVLLFEFVVKWLAGLIARRFMLQIGIKELMLQIRLLLIIGNFVIGLLGIVNFFNVDAGNLVNAITEFAILAFLYGWYYEWLRKKYVPIRFQSSLFVYIARMFIGIFLILSIYNFLYYIVMMDIELTVIEIITLTLDLIIKIAVALVAYFYNKHIKKTMGDFGDINPKDKFNKNGSNINVNPFDFDKVNDKKEEKKEEDKVFKDFDL